MSCLSTSTCWPIEKTPPNAANSTRTQPKASAFAPACESRAEQEQKKASTKSADALADFLERRVT